jgi:hypothetical protein
VIIILVFFQPVHPLGIAAVQKEDYIQQNTDENCLVLIVRRILKAIIKPFLFGWQHNICFEEDSQDC